VDSKSRKPLPWNPRGRPSWKYWGPKTFTFCSVFDDFETYWRISLNEKWHRQSGKNIGKYRGQSTRVPYILPNFTNLNRTSVLPKLSILFRPQSTAHALSGINVAPHSESKWNGIAFVCSSTQIVSSSNKILTWRWHHVGRP